MSIGWHIDQTLEELESENKKVPSREGLQSQMNVSTTLFPILWSELMMKVVLYP